MDEIPATSLAGGRLLYYMPDWNSQDGVSRHATQGFFDTYDAPPWDTWLAYFYEPDDFNYLVCWIPPTHIQLAAEGISANLDGSIDWLDDAKDSVVARLLRERGLL